MPPGGIGNRLCRPDDYLAGATTIHIYRKGDGVPTAPEKETRIIARLVAKPHASFVASKPECQFRLIAAPNHDPEEIGFRNLRRH
jgi:hypothetical protein